MAYAGDRVVHDADSHLMEPVDWLVLDGDGQDSGGVLPLQGLEPLIAAGQAARAAVADDPSARRQAGAELLIRKNWDALGAFDGTHRTHALDLLGFRSQLVFSSFSHPVLVRYPGSPAANYDDDTLYRVARDHNIGMAEFCADDDRLLGVAFVPLDDPARALTAAREALDNGCAAVELPSFPVASVSIAHPTFEPLYQLLEERGAPLLFHIGGDGRSVPTPYEHSGRPRPGRRWEGQMAEPALTFVAMPHRVEMALAALAFDGVFEDHPGLRCGVMELGASWFPAYLRRLDLAFAEFASPYQRQHLRLAPSEYLLRAVRVVPFNYEDLMWLLAETPGQPYLFGSDYPHDEGGEDPLGRCSRRLADASAADVDLFFRGNFEYLMGAALPASVRTATAGLGSIPASPAS